MVLLRNIVLLRCLVLRCVMLVLCRVVLTNGAWCWCWFWCWFRVVCETSETTDLSSVLFTGTCFAILEDRCICKSVSLGFKTPY